MTRPRNPRKAAGAEAAFQDEVLGLARLYGWRFYHTHDSRRSTPGFPDLVLLRPPRLIFAELKTPGGRLSSPQIEWLKDLESVAAQIQANANRIDRVVELAGGDADKDPPALEVYVWRTEDLPAIADVLCGGDISPEIGRAWAHERRLAGVQAVTSLVDKAPGAQR